MAPLPRGRETILLVEDDTAVRGFARRVLAAQGYTVLEAGNGIAALGLAAQHAAAIDLLVTDVVMPGLNGRVLADRLRALRPDLPVLYVSGFPEKHLDEPELVGPRVAFLQKPYSADAIARAVRASLDQLA